MVVLAHFEGQREAVNLDKVVTFYRKENNISFEIIRTCALIEQKIVTWNFDDDGECTEALHYLHTLIS